MAVKRVVRFKLDGGWWSLPIDRYEEMVAVAKITGAIPNTVKWGALKLSRKPYDAETLPNLNELFTLEPA